MLLSLAGCLLSVCERVALAGLSSLAGTRIRRKQLVEIVPARKPDASGERAGKRNAWGRRVDRADPAKDRQASLSAHRSSDSRVWRTRVGRSRRPETYGRYRTRRPAPGKGDSHDQA